MIKWWKQFRCNHSWCHYNIGMVDKTMEIRTCGKCDKSETVKAVMK